MEKKKTVEIMSPGSGTIPLLLSEVVKKYGSQTAVRQKKFGLWCDISWDEYFEQITFISSALVSMGFTKGDKVAIIGDNAPEWVMIDLGCIYAGGVTVGIYSTNAWKQCEYIIMHSESIFLFVENEEQLDKWLQFKEKASQLRKVIYWDDKGLHDFEDPMVMDFNEFVNQGREFQKQHPHLMEELETSIKPDDAAMLIYTSGTTGLPKGAILTHSNICWMAEAISLVNPLYNSDEVLSFLPLCHIFERLFSVISHIKHGYIVNFIENLDTITANMIEISPTVGYGVPRIWEKYHSSILIKMDDATWLKKTIFNLALKIGNRYIHLKQKNNSIPPINRAGYILAHFLIFRKLKERLGFDRLRIAYSGAAPISQDVLTFFRSIGVNLQEGYGQTEGTGVTSVCPSNNFKVDTVGQPLPGSEVKIAEDGEILVKSPAVFVGYYKDEPTTTQTLVNGWLHSGDLGELDEHGFLKITGRKKDIIVTAGGKNIAPQYIENNLKFSPYINDAIIIGDNRKFITAVILIDEDNVVKYAQDNKIQFSTYGSLAMQSEINNLIQKEVDKVNEELARVEQIKKFKILPKKLYEEDGEVTPTMKIKRSNIEKQYHDLIEDMYK